MAEARQATHEPQVRYNEDGTGEKGHTAIVAKRFYQDMKACVVRTELQIYNGLWPTTWRNLLVALIICFVIMFGDHPKLSYISHYLWLLGGYLYLDDSYPYLLRILLISLVSSLAYFMCVLYVRQYLLRILLSYKGWLYQPPKSQSVVVMIWALFVRVVSGRKPRLYSYQNSLPRMNVPPLKSTVTKLLESLKPILNKEEFQKMELNAKEFLATIGPKLQWVLYVKSWWAPNYHTDWWEKYVYLMSRDPIAINSNYYLHDQMKSVPTKCQTARAAGVTSLILLYKTLLDSEELAPLVIRNTIPTCMWQYQRMFSMARIPRTDGDIIRQHPGVQHIVVLAKGHFYKLYVVDAHGKRLNALDFQVQFEWILKDAEMWESKGDDAELHIAALTGNDRTTWAQCRRQHFTSGVNRESIHAIEEGIILVILDDNEFTDMSDRAKYILHGDGSSLWFDKSINMICFKDGRMGFNCEHSWSDAPVIGHLTEYVFTSEYSYRIYGDDGNCKPYHSPDTTVSTRSKAAITPMRLYWDINTDLVRSIKEARAFSIKNNEDLELYVGLHEAFGKGFMKKTKNSPDAFIQMAMQLAYFRDSGGLFAHTYEASMTRLYLQGRTETVRSLTQEVQEFVLAMNGAKIPSKEKVRLMKVAADMHQNTYRDCMSGKGIDRHLFALYVVCKGQGYDSPFLKSVLTMPWTLSTSQVQILQYTRGIDCNMPEVRDSLSPAGGFGPVSDSGYGVAYAMINENMTSFHVSAKKSCAKTDSRRFLGNIFWALSEMKKICDEVVIS